MRVRVRIHPNGDRWVVEQLFWMIVFPVWSMVEVFFGDDAKDNAIAYADRMINPEIIEIRRRK